MSTPVAACPCGSTTFESLGDRLRLADGIYAERVKCAKCGQLGTRTTFPADVKPLERLSSAFKKVGDL